MNIAVVVSHEELSSAESHILSGGLWLDTTLQYSRGYTEAGHHQYTGEQTNSVSMSKYNIQLAFCQEIVENVMCTCASHVQTAKDIFL